MKKDGLFIAGLTEDGKQCFGGVFKYQDTHGIPLILLWKKLQDMNAAIAWDCYVKDAMRHGWSKDKIMSGIREIANFGYGGEEGRRFVERMSQWMDRI